MLPLLLAMLLPSQAPPARTADLQQSAIAALSAKCTQCHGTQVPHPKASFGFVNDAARLIASNKYVVPGSPEKSEIWKQIRDDDMPPEKARMGPLTDAEKEAIRAWIASLPATSVSQPAESRPPPRRAAGALVLLGRAHVVAVHFPIALLAFSAGSELVARLRQIPSDRRNTRATVAIGSLSACLAAGLGWLHAFTDGFGSPFVDLLSLANLHRWIGTVAAVMSLGALALLSGDGPNAGQRRWTTLAAIIATAVLTGVAAHFGGLLTHGKDFLTP